MKLISRKALVAGATALSVTFAGTAVATAAEETPVVSQNPQGSSASTTGKLVQNNDSNAGKNNGKEGKKDFSLKEANPNDIKAWIGVFTAAIGALGTLFAFADKYLDIEGFLKNFKLPF